MNDYIDVYTRGQAIEDGALVRLQDFIEMTGFCVQERRFRLGELLITQNATTSLSGFVAVRAISRHADGDWGVLCDEDRLANEQALTNGGRLFSAYHTDSGVKFWVITEADRAATTVLLPEDY